VTGPIIFGAIAGIGVVGLFVGVRPRRRSLAGALELLDADFIAGLGVAGSGIPVAAIPPTKRANLQDQLRFWLGDKAEQTVSLLPAVKKTLDGDLMSADWTLGSLAEKCLLGGLAGTFFPFAAWGVLTTSGIPLPLVLPVWVGLVAAVLGVSVPILELRARATKGRRQARRMIGCFLDLVVLALAGGLGIEGALHAAATVCQTRVSRRLVGALNVARDAGHTPWDALRTVGKDIGVPELVELASAVSLAGTEGARIKSTLATKAASIRSHELSDAEADANAVTERLFLPGVLLLVGFLIFIGYPAVVRATAGL